MAPLIDRNGAITTDDCEKSVILNEFLSSVFTKENINSISHHEQVFKGDAKERLLDVDVSQSIVEMKLNKLNMNKASGVDGIYPNLLRELPEQLSGPLNILFRRTLDEGIVPTDWRAANLTPLYKKGNKRTPCNYRPVNLTSIVCKVLESIIKDAIMEHLEQHKLINVSQHGFLPGRSCLTNMLAYLESVTKHVDVDYQLTLCIRTLLKHSIRFPIEDYC